MKKRFCEVTVAVLCVLFALSGCGGGADAEPPYDYDLSEYVTLGQYKGIVVPVGEITVTEEEIQDEIQRRLDAATVEEERTEGVVEDGDIARIDFEGKRNGVAFSGGTGERDLLIGSGEFIPGFEDGLIGEEIGETVVLELTFPDPYPNNEELAGQAVAFTVTIHSVIRQVPATFDLAFVRANSDLASVDAYRDSVEEDLLRGKQEALEAEKEEYVWMEILAGSEVLQYPEKELREFIEQSKSLYQDYAEMYQMSWEEFLSTQMGATEEEFDEQLEEYARDQIEQEMVLFAIAREEGLEVSEEEYEATIQEYIEAQGFDSERAYKNANGGQSFEQVVGRKNIELSLLAPKVFDFLMEEAIEAPIETSPTDQTLGE